MHVCGLLVLDPSTMEGDPYDCIRSMLVKALPEVSLMRKRLATVPLGIGRPFWVDDVDFDVERHLHRVHLSPPGASWSLAHVVGDVASRPLRRDRPLWEVWLIEGLAEGRMALLAKMHHTTIDGTEGVSIMGKLFDFGVPARAGSGQEDDWEPHRLPHQLELLRRSLLGRVTDSLEVTRLLPATVARLGATLWHLWTRRGSGQGTVKPFTAPRTSFSATLTPRRSIAFTDVSLADVKTVKEAFGVKFNDVATAVVGGGLRRYLVDRGELPNRPLVAAEPVSVHGRVGNVKGVTKLSVIFSTLATDVEDPVERLRAVASANVRRRRSARRWDPTRSHVGPGRPGPTPCRSPAPVLGLAGCRAPPGDLQRALLERGGSTFRPLPGRCTRCRTYAWPITDGAGLNVTVISTGDQIGFGIVACPDLIPEVWDLAKAIPDALDELTVEAKRLRSDRRQRRPRTA